MKYYWIRLKTDFFQQLHIKLLRKMENGDRLLVVYMKMLLLSAKYNNEIRYECDDDFAETLAVDLDEDVEDVRIVLNFLEGRKLIRKTDDGSTLTEAECAVGSDTTEAARKRAARQKHNPEVQNQDMTRTTAEQHVDATGTNGGQVLDKYWTNGGQMADKCPENVRNSLDKRPTEIEIDKDIEIDIKKERKKKKERPADESARNVFALFNSQVRPLTEVDGEKLRDALEEFGEDAVRKGIEEAVRLNKRNAGYVAYVAQKATTSRASPKKNLF